jgi:hypothetical protein
MIKQFDRLLLRVDSLPAAAKFWRDIHGASILREDRNSIALALPGGGEVVLHGDASLPAQQYFLLVDDVRAMHDLRQELMLDFRSPPTKGSRGYFATIRDPFGAVLNITDRTLEQPRGEDAAHDAPGALFDEPIITQHKPDRDLLAKLYVQLGRTADDLPYTTHFESLYDSYVANFPDPKPDHAEVWRHLLTTRKAGRLPKLGAARSAPPEVEEADRELLRKLLGDQIGKRDRLPYSAMFDDLVTKFNAGRRRPYSPHQIWRLAATMAK